MGAVAALGLWVGAMWDIAWHGDVGRDTFFTPPHLFILGGIGLMGMASLWATIPAGRTVRERARRRPGMALAGVCAALQLLGLAVDNWWHGVFGLDVTLWSPPHLLLLFLGWLAIVGLLADHAASGSARAPGLAVACGLVLCVSTAVLAEYDFGFPHFRMLWAPLLLAALSAGGFTMARRSSGLRYAATVAAGSAIALRLVGLAVHVIVHRSLPTPPLGLLAGGLAFDLLLLARFPQAAAAAGSWLATFGASLPWLAVEGRTVWPRSILLPAAVLGIGTAMAGAALGAAIGRRLHRLQSGAEAPVEVRRPSRRVLAAGAAAAGVLLLGAVPALAGQGAAATAQGQPVRPATLAVDGDHVDLNVPGAVSGDLVTVFGAPPGPHQARRWEGVLTWSGPGRFSGTVRSIPSGRLEVWYITSDDSAWGRGLGTRSAPAQWTADASLYKAESFAAGIPPRWLRPAAFVDYTTLSVRVTVSVV
jgi:hypothetical protein